MLGFRAKAAASGDFSGLGRKAHAQTRGLIFIAMFVAKALAQSSSLVRNLPTAAILEAWVAGASKHVATLLAEVASERESGVRICTVASGHRHRSIPPLTIGANVSVHTALGRTAPEDYYEESQAHHGPTQLAGASIHAKPK